MTPVRHSIIGLPFSGKTTFLAAFWHLLNANEVTSKFTLDKLIGDHTHLNTITEAWLKCVEVQRTKMAAETKVAIHVKETATGKQAILHFPDMAGESYERQLSTRSCAPDYVDGFEGAGGILLFVTANRGSDGMAIVDVAPLEPGEAIVEQVDEHKEWTPEMLPLQVSLVDLLQFLQQKPFYRVQRRVAIVVSAWDVIDNPNLEPGVWLQRELPLLHQFLLTNSDSFVFQVYGVSAQGGDVKGTGKDALLDKTPSTRIICKGPETDPHDLTSPIVWLMSNK